MCKIGYGLNTKMTNENNQEEVLIELKRKENLPENFYSGIVMWDADCLCCKNKSYYKNKLLHREDGPAVEYKNGTKEWYKEGKLHREGGPAIEQADGRKEWYKEGELHREDGPAIERVDGTKQCWVGGVRYSNNFDITNKLYLGKEKGKYGLDWLRFLGEEGIEEYPIILGIEYKITKNYSLGSFLESHK